jgi:hypothetical protein
MSDWAAIRYRDFWDVPRIFLVSHHGKSFLFDCAFDETAEDYPNSYKVYIMPELSEDALAGSWQKLADRAVLFLGQVPVSKVQFDPSRRREIDAAVLDEFAAAIGGR